MRPQTTDRRLETIDYRLETADKSMDKPGLGATPQAVHAGG